MHFNIFLGILCFGFVTGGSIFKRDVDGWTCARECIQANSTDTADTVSKRLKRHSEPMEPKIESLLDSFQSFCGALNDERFSCIAQCPPTNTSENLKADIADMQSNVCSNVSAMTESFSCTVKGSSSIKTCVTNDCRESILDLGKFLLENLLAENSTTIIPGEKFCAVETCVQNCVKNYVVPQCGVDVYDAFEKMQDIEDRLLALLALDEEPTNGEKCFDIPLNEIVVTKEVKITGRID